MTSIDKPLGSFQVLPFEVRIDILTKNLSIREILNVTQVCQAWNETTVKTDHGVAAGARHENDRGFRLLRA